MTKFKKTVKPKLNVNVKTDKEKSEGVEITPEERNENFKVFTLFALRSVCNDIDDIREALDRNAHMLQEVVKTICGMCESEDCKGCVFNVEKED